MPQTAHLCRVLKIDRARVFGPLWSIFNFLVGRVFGSVFVAPALDDVLLDVVAAVGVVATFEFATDFELTFVDGVSVLCTADAFSTDGSACVETCFDGDDCTMRGRSTITGAGTGVTVVDATVSSATDDDDDDDTVGADFDVDNDAFVLIFGAVSAII